ncbi:MAG: helix-turn-helix domain-containing protein [Actinomycetota bacterium]|nr:helix-turn-helix domain-containing protein [Actinomycetota bacterium]
MTLSPARPLSDRYLSQDERVRIADLHHGGLGVRAIAVEIGRALSTISRELDRNAGDDGRYRPHAANTRASTRRARPRQRRIATDAGLRSRVQDLLKVRWGPEQIAHETAGASCRPALAAPSRGEHLPGDLRPSHATGP